MSSLVKSIRFLSSDGTVDKTYTEIGGDLAVRDTSPNIELASRLDRRRGVGKALTIPVLEPTAYADLKPLMLGQKELDVYVETYDGTDQWKKGRATVVPILSNLPDVKSWVWALNTVDVATKPPVEAGSTDWKVLGPSIGEAAPEPGVETVADGIGRPLMNYSRLVQMVVVPGVGQYPALSALENARTAIQVAGFHPDGTYRLMKNLQVEVRVLPNSGGAGLYSTEVRLFATGHDFSDYITFPLTARADFYGALVEFVTFGYREADILTTSVGSVTPAP